MTLDVGPRERRKKKLIIAAALFLVLMIIGGAIATWWILRPAPFGLETRVPWTTSNFIGSSEAPDPFTVERLFPNLKFTKPTEIVLMPAGKRIAVVQQDGKIFTFANDNATLQADLLVDLTAINGFNRIAGAKGINAYGLAFDPSYKDNHFCYVCYAIAFPPKRTTEYPKIYPQSRTGSRVSRFTVTGEIPTIDPRTERILITWPAGGHNGGCIRFGPDRDLYIATGDNGDSTPPDPFNVGQDIEDLRGKILRIDVQTSTPGTERLYSIPADNPFSSTRSAQPEIFAYGLQNPWRFSFDRGTGEPWVADVGWERWETVHHLTVGGNYGWSIREGPQPVHPAGKVGPTPIIPPLLALPHTEAGAIIGGFVYRGTRIPSLTGQYIFGDWVTRRIWAAPVNGVRLGSYRRIAQTDLRIVAFGEDAGGELLILDHERGGIYHLVPNSAAPTIARFPSRLSETGLFSNTANQQPNPGVFPFAIAAPQWLDNASAERFVAIPGNESVIDREGEPRTFPKGTVLARTLSLSMVAGDANSRRRIETQILHYDGSFWHAYSYHWNDAQDDAALVDDKGADLPLTIVDPAAPGGRREQIWRFNSRAQCMTCHTRWTGYALAFNEPQLDITAKYQTATHGLVSDNQLRSFRHIGLLPTPKPIEAADNAPAVKPVPPVVLVNPYEDDPKISLDDRARSYLHVNCSTCHRYGGGGSAIIDLTRSKDLRETRLTMEPMLGSFNLPDAQIVSPGDPSRSVLMLRMAKSGAGHMPMLGATMVDEAGVDLVAKWIVSLRGSPGALRISQETKQELGLERTALQSLQNGAVGNTAIAAMEKLLASPAGALKLQLAMQEGRIAATLRPAIIQRATAVSDSTVRELFSRFVPDAGSAARMGIAPDISRLFALPGSSDRGKRIFFEYAGGLCGKCHVVGDQGAEFGPNLTHIATKYSKSDILDNILHPSKTILPGYETYVVTTKSEPSRPGMTYVGFLVSKSSTDVVLKDQTHKLVHLSAGDVEKISKQSLSAMPEGLLMDLDYQQGADLLEFLASRK